MKEIGQSDVCKSVFKGGKAETTGKEFTKMWILLVNTLEKSKGVGVCKTEN